MKVFKQKARVNKYRDNAVWQLYILWLFDLVLCQLVCQCLLSFPPSLLPIFICFSYLSNVVITILATDGFDSTDIQPSKDLWAGINPQLIPVTKRSINDSLIGLIKAIICSQKTKKKQEKLHKLLSTVAVLQMLAGWHLRWVRKSFYFAVSNRTGNENRDFLALNHLP